MTTQLYSEVIDATSNLAAQSEEIKKRLGTVGAIEDGSQREALLGDPFLVGGSIWVKKSGTGDAQACRFQVGPKATVFDLLKEAYATLYSKVSRESLPQLELAVDGVALDNTSFVGNFAELFNGDPSKRSLKVVEVRRRFTRRTARKKSPAEASSAGTALLQRQQRGRSGSPPFKSGAPAAPLASSAPAAPRGHSPSSSSAPAGGTSSPLSAGRCVFQAEWGSPLCATCHLSRASHVSFPKDRCELQDKIVRAHARKRAVSPAAMLADARYMGRSPLWTPRSRPGTPGKATSPLRRKPSATRKAGGSGAPGLVGLLHGRQQFPTDHGPVSLGSSSVRRSPSPKDFGATPTKLVDVLPCSKFVPVWGVPAQCAKCPFRRDDHEKANASPPTAGRSHHQKASSSSSGVAARSPASSALANASSPSGLAAARRSPPNAHGGSARRPRRGTDDDVGGASSGDGLSNVSPTPDSARRLGATPPRQQPQSGRHQDPLPRTAAFPRRELEGRGTHEGAGRAIDPQRRSPVDRGDEPPRLREWQRPPGSRTWDHHVTSAAGAELLPTVAREWYRSTRLRVCRRFMPLWNHNDYCARCYQPLELHNNDGGFTVEARRLEQDRRRRGAADNSSGHRTRNAEEEGRSDESDWSDDSHGGNHQDERAAATTSRKLALLRHSRAVGPEGSAATNQRPSRQEAFALLPWPTIFQYCAVEELLTAAQTCRSLTLAARPFITATMRVVLTYEQPELRDELREAADAIAMTLSPALNDARGYFAFRLFSLVLLSLGLPHADANVPASVTKRTEVLLQVARLPASRLSKETGSKLAEVETLARLPRHGSVADVAEPLLSLLRALWVQRGIQRRASRYLAFPQIPL